MSHTGPALGRFIILAAFIFGGSVVLLARFDLLPAPSAKPEVALALAPAPHERVPVPELPTKVEIPTLGLAASVENPRTTDRALLDRALLVGAVRYPTSAKLGEDGNVVLFGHSSYLPIVSNQAYKTFDGIQKLAVGDTITVYSAAAAYTYAVVNVAKENIATGAIPLLVSGRVLTLVTCNSFATKGNRFVVTATLVDSHPVSS